ncbi:uncharacterized protein LOC117202095 isoform X4 [Orcinus orca]|uniref:uncharacterized protein LOC117202095 isoform X4 n=1 Tax=Orcinus orca TaxID=9733 RepID=UPI0021124D84|nr:uncharacterized protein LOC117202095 isoform X4 [Orcinus orca]XP_049558301.1 uncharacterized protein LOC117202095 isoform X4 [Orcinus orca]
MTMSAPSPGQRLQKQREMPPRGLQSRPSPSDPPPTTPAQLGGSGGGARAPGRPHARAPRPRATRRGTGSGDGAGQRPSGGVGCEEAVVAEKRPEASALNNKRISEAWEVQDQGVSRFGVCSEVLKFNMGPTGLKSRYHQGFIPFWRLWGKICFLGFSSFYRMPAFLGSWYPSSIFKASNGLFLEMYSKGKSTQHSAKTSSPAACALLAVTVRALVWVSFISTFENH